jgi:stage III sporulation protein AG
MDAQAEKQTRMEQKTGDKSKTGLLARYLKLDTKKKIQYAAILLIVIVILTIYFSSVAKNRSNENSEASSGAAAPVAETAEPADDIARRLQETLSAIEGAGRVEVMITYESTKELVPAFSVDQQISTTVDESSDGKSTTNSENSQSEIVTISGSDGSKALILKENSPKIKGVIVVAEGADDIGVKLNLLSAVQTILDVSPDQVNVYKMNNE